MEQLERNGWKLYYTTEFKEVILALEAEAKAISESAPDNFDEHPTFKLYEAVMEIIETLVPSNPDAKEHRQGLVLGSNHTHWRRVKGHGLPGRLRLFFQFRSDSKEIVFAWLNDNQTLRKSGAKTDVYVVFEKMLKSGKPPSNWSELIKSALPIPENS